MLATLQPSSASATLASEETCLAQATTGDCMTHARWCHDMAGDEYARIYSWGKDPKRKPDYESASPCSHADLPQTEFEPIIVRRAAAEGWDVRFSTSFLSYETQLDGSILSRLRDDLTKQEFYVHSQYLFGCDGARSQVLRQAAIPLIKKPGQGLAIDVLVDVDLSDFVEARRGNPHWVFQPDREYPDFAWAGLIRMVKPWNQHPPFNGLGSNTCVQDAYNLAWKIKYVSHQLASPSLLESFSKERQPVGLGVITRANQGIRDHTPVWNALGLTQTSVEDRMKFFSTLSESSELGRGRRKRLNAAVENTSQEFHGIGVEMNHYYESGAVDLTDEIKASRRKPEWPKDSTLYHLATTYPGHRLPHAWLNLRMPLKNHFSTIDLAGHGAFCLFTGIGGEQWKEAAQSVSKDLGVEIRAYGIGWGQDYEDVYRDWEKKREVEENGAILVRPNRFVCWRGMQVDDECKEKLSDVMKTVLGRMN